MAQSNPTASLSAVPDTPLFASPHPVTEEPDATPSAEWHEAGTARAGLPSSLEQLRHSAKQWSRHAMATLTDSCEITQRQIQAAIVGTRQRIIRAADQKPIHFIAAVALSALVAGVLLRVWRSSRYD